MSRSCTRFLPLSAICLCLVPGCSREPAAPAAAAADAAAAQAAPSVAQSEAPDGVAASSTPAANPERDFALQVNRLAQQADEHEERGYFDQAIAVREELVRMFIDHYGEEGWQTRSARLALARSVRLKDLNSTERAANTLSGQQQRAAQQLWQQGQPQLAFAALVEARTLAVGVWGEENSVVAAMIDQEARWRLGVGERTTSESLFRQALATREKILARNHPDTFASYSTLGLLMQAEGRFDDAETLMRTAADQARMIWGATHLEYATQLNNLGMLLDEVGKTAEASELLTQSLQIRRHTLGENHPTVGEGLLNLGKVHYASKDYAQASPVFGEALAIFQSALGSDHRLTRLARINFAISRMAERRFDEAESLLRDELDSTRRACGQNSAEYAEDSLRMAVVYGNQGRFTDALPWAEQALETYRAVSGEDDGRTVQARQLTNRIQQRAHQPTALDASTVERAQALMPVDSVPATAQGDARQPRR